MSSKKKTEQYRPDDKAGPSFPTLAVLLFCLLAISAFLFGFKQITDADTLWHLKSGQLIYEKGPPHEDTFSFRTAGREWIDAQWLFQLIIYLVYRLAGFAGLSVFTGVVIALAWLLLFYAGWDERAGPVSWALLMLSLWSSSERFNLRPEILSFVMIAVYLAILERDRAKPTRAVFVLIIFQIFWANIEGIWPIGLVIIGTYWIEAIIVRHVSKPWLDRPAAGSPARLMILLMLATAVCFATPYFYKGFFFPLTLFRESALAHYYKDAIIEFLPTFTEGDIMFLRMPFLILIIISAAGFILNPRKLRPAHLVLWTAFLYLSLSANRNIGLFSISAAFFASYNFSGFLARHAHKTDSGRIEFFRWVFLATGLGLAVFYCVALPTNKIYKWDMTQRIFGPGFPARYELAKAADFLKMAGWKGKIFNDEVSGGYLIWIGAPDWKVYVDGRLELYGPRLIKEAFERSNDYFLFTQEDLRWGFDAAIFAHARSRDLGTLTLVNKLYVDPAWALVYLDNAAAVYLKDTPSQHGLVTKYRIKLK